nr:hypothetical protein Pyn_10821 [Ipomoea batatas]
MPGLGEGLVGLGSEPDLDERGLNGVFGEREDLVPLRVGGGDSLRDSSVVPELHLPDQVGPSFFQRILVLCGGGGVDAHSGHSAASGGTHGPARGRNGGPGDGCYDDGLDVARSGVHRLGMALVLGVHQFIVVVILAELNHHTISASIEDLFGFLGRGEIKLEAYFPSDVREEAPLLERVELRGLLPFPGHARPGNQDPPQKVPPVGRPPLVEHVHLHAPVRQVRHIVHMENKLLVPNRVQIPVLHLCPLPLIFKLNLHKSRRRPLPVFRHQVVRRHHLHHQPLLPAVHGRLLSLET